jgi:hypothetical protein
MTTQQDLIDSIHVSLQRIVAATSDLQGLANIDVMAAREAEVAESIFHYLKPPNPKTDL